MGCRSCTFAEIGQSYNGVNMWFCKKMPGSPHTIHKYRMTDSTSPDCPVLNLLFRQNKMKGPPKFYFRDPMGPTPTFTSLWLSFGKGKMKCPPKFYFKNVVLPIRVQNTINILEWSYN